MTPAIITLSVLAVLAAVSLLLLCERVEAGIAWVWSRVCSWRGGR